MNSLLLRGRTTLHRGNGSGSRVLVEGNYERLALLAQRGGGVTHSLGSCKGLKLAELTRIETSLGA